jgi:hypothetical protein
MSFLLTAPLGSPVPARAKQKGPRCRRTYDTDVVDQLDLKEPA